MLDKRCAMWSSLRPLPSCLLLDTTPIPPAVLAAHEDFVLRRRSLGRGAPDAYARACFEAFGVLEEAEIRVEQAGVDRLSALVVSERVDRFHYLRDDLLD